MNDPTQPPVTVIADVRACPPRLATLGALARLSLDMRRCGFPVILRGASSDLCSLIQLAGLDHALGLGREPLPTARTVVMPVLAHPRNQSE